MKNIIKGTVFLLIFGFVFAIIYHIFWITPNSITYFYNEPKNSLDIVYLGASNVDQSFNTTLAYNLYGYTTGILSSSSQPITLTESLIEEVKKYQSPSLYILDISRVAYNIDEIQEAEIRKVTDNMKFSKNRINAIKKALSYKSDVDEEQYINYYVSWLMYHNGYKSLNRYHIYNTSLYKGFIFEIGTIGIEPLERKSYKENSMELPKENEELLLNLLEYIKSNDLNVLFVVPIRNFEESINLRLNDAIKIISEEGFNVINFNTMENELNIDFSKDFHDTAHLNVKGATKYTLYFSRYLKENYELQDHRGDENYISWNKEYERFKQDYKKLLNKEFDELLLEYNINS